MNFYESCMANQTKQILIFEANTILFPFDNFKKLEYVLDVEYNKVRDVISMIVNKNHKKFKELLYKCRYEEITLQDELIVEATYV